MSKAYIYSGLSNISEVAEDVLKTEDVMVLIKIHIYYCMRTIHVVLAESASELQAAINGICARVKSRNLV